MQRAVTALLAVGLTITCGKRVRMWLASRKPEEDPLSIISDSARVIAAWRAIETEEEEPLCCDEFAAALAGPTALQNARMAAQTFDGKEIPGKPQRQRKFRVSNVGARVWWFDTRVRAALASGPSPPRQVVVLGSGMDTRPWRCEDIPRDTRWFEVDLPDVVATKQRALSALGAELNRQGEPGARAVRHPLHASSWASLAADLSGESWVGDLRQLGFDPEVPTLWILEGLLMYLEPAGAAALLRTLSGQSAVGSTLLSHNVTDELVLGVADASIQAYPPYDMDLVATWHYGFPADPRPAFQDLGWRVTECSSRGEIARQIFGVESDAELEGCTQFDARLGCDIDRYSAFVAATVDKEGHAVNN